MSQAKTPEKARRQAMVRLLQKVQHAIPGFVLIQEGVASLREGVEGWHRGLAIAEVLVCLAVLVTLARAFREHAKHLREQTVPHVHLGIDWIDIFLGGMCFTEAWAKYLDHGHLARPTILLGITMIAFGLFGGKLIAWKQRRAD